MELAAAQDVVAAADVDELAAAVLEAAAELEEDVVVELAPAELLELELDEAGEYMKRLSLSEPPQVSSRLPSQGMTHPPSVEGT